MKRTFIAIAFFAAVSIGCSKGDETSDTGSGTAPPETIGRAPNESGPARSRPAAIPRTITYVFECDDYEIIARFETKDALVQTPDGSFRLPPAETADGNSFSNGQATLWRDGETASFEIDGRRYESCQNNKQRAIWQDAKMRGVSFRGVGNEPGWVLEIDSQITIFRTNYGEDEFAFPTSIPELDSETMAATYTMSARGHTLKVMLRHETCADTMADSQFETSVEVLLDGETQYNGCGRTL